MPDLRRRSPSARAMLAAALHALCALAALPAADWPHMGGPIARHAAEDGSLRAGWTGAEATVAWRFPLSSDLTGQVAAAGGRVFAVDHDEATNEAVLVVVDLDGGAVLWRCAWPTPGLALLKDVKRPYAMPAVDAQRVYVTGPQPSTLRAIGRAARQQAWLFEATAHGFSVYPKASPNVSGDLVFVSAKKGKLDALLAIDAASGALRWSCIAPFVPALNGSMMNAPQATTIAGVPQVVFHHTSGVCGVGLDGKLLWNWDGYSRMTLTATPTISPDGYVFVSSGHEGSSALVRVTRDGGVWICTPVFADGRFTKPQGPAPHLIHGNWNINSAAWWDGHFYAVGIKGLHCMRSDGSFAWTSDTGDAGNPSTIVVDGRVITFAGGKAQGTMLIAKADPAGFTELARLKIHSGNNKTQFVYADGRILHRSARDKEIVCVDLGARGITAVASTAGLPADTGAR